MSSVSLWSVLVASSAFASSSSSSDTGRCAGVAREVKVVSAFQSSMGVSAHSSSSLDVDTSGGGGGARPTDRLCKVLIG